MHTGFRNTSAGIPLTRQHVSVLHYKVMFQLFPRDIGSFNKEISVSKLVALFSCNSLTSGKHVREMYTPLNPTFI